MKTKVKVTDEDIDKIHTLLKEEKNSVVKERLTFVSMHMNGLKNRKIAKILGRDETTVGKWINAYFYGGIDALQDRRGGDRRSFLGEEEKRELKEIINNTYPIIHKGWDGKIIVDLIDTKYDAKYTRDGVYKLLRSLGISHKIATKRDPKKSEEVIADWKEDIKKTN